MAETRADTAPSVRRKALFVGLTAVLMALALEGLAHLFHFAVYGELYARGQLWSESEARDDFTTDGVTHPYFGFTTPWVHHPLNNMPPLLAHDSTLLVGVFGGSVAQQVRHVFRERLAAFLAEEGVPLAPVVVELAQGGMKQPQQVHALAYMLAAGAEFDLIVNLDGHNDLAAPHYNAQRGLFPTFPHLWDKRVGAAADDTLLLGRAILLERDRDRLKEIGDTALGLSAIAGLVLRRSFESLDERILGLNQQLMVQVQKYDVETHGPRWAWYGRGEDEHEDAVRELAVQVWFRSSLVMANLAETAGADYVHFLQPSQYIAGSKPLTAEELATAYEPGWSEGNYAESYPLVAKHGAELRQAGVHFVDLTKTFAEVAETIYIDTCCHVNPRGARMLATRMVDAIKPAVRRRAKAQPEARKSALAAARRPVQPDVLVAENYYDVHLRDGKWLVYRREACLPEDTEAPFFVHVTPSNSDTLPPERKPYGLDNLDFTFAHGGAFTADGACFAQVWLPAYHFTHIRTGQVSAAGRIWEAEFDVPPLPEPAEPSTTEANPAD